MREAAYKVERRRGGGGSWPLFSLREWRKLPVKTAVKKEDVQSVFSFGLLEAEASPVSPGSVVRQFGEGS